MNPTIGEADEAPRPPVLTSQQRAPLGVKGASIALSAGAGCGKTTVLTERFLHALGGDDRRPLRSVLAVTFTEKAAGELRKRIRAESRGRLAAAPESEVAHWRAVLRGLEAAPVSTFHEYCAGLLRRHAAAAGVDPDFRVLDPTLARPVLDEAVDRCLRKRLAASDPDLIELGVEYGLANLRDALSSLASRRDADGLGAWKERTDDEVIAAWQSAWSREGRPAVFRKFLAEAAECRRLIAANECTHKGMKERCGEVLRIFALLEADDPDVALLDGLAAQARVQGGGNATHWPSPDIFDKVKETFEKLRKSIGALTPKFEFDEAVSLRCAALGRKLAGLAAESRRVYDAGKRARGGLDFDDLLLKTLALLRADAASVREAPGRPVGFVLVDEFQDTDPVQSEILRLLCGDSFARGGLFVVGDFKQSVYRFRGARPEIFQGYRDEFPEAGRLELSENFRSSPGVIAFVNALFAEAFPPERPRLVPGPHARDAGDRPAVDFVWAEEAQPQPAAPGKKPPRIPVDLQRQTEARWLARLVRSRLDAGWPLIDRETKQARDAGAGDVAFLFRAMTDVAPYERALEAEGLDYHVVGGSAFYAQQEVQDLVNVLSVVEDPHNALALAGALRSPFFGLSDEGLFWLGGDGKLAAGLADCDRAAGLSPSDRQRATRARDLLARWGDLKDRVPIASLVDRVLDESGYEAALLGEHLGDRKRANARKFVQLARRFDAAGEYNLGHFVARLRADLREPPKEGQAATTDEGGKSVRLMSIHQAKGLEFPIVVVPDLNRKPPNSRDSVAFDAALGVLVKPPAAAADADSEPADGSGLSLGWMTYRAVEAYEDDREADRLFYVAVTRARDALVLSAGLGPEAKPDSPALRLLAERFDRRTGRCKASLPEGWSPPAVGVCLTPPPAGARPEARRRPSPREAADVIASAVRQPAAPGEGPRPVLPRSFDLDPARGLSARAARRDGLIRAVLSDPRGLDPAALGRVVRLAARRRAPFLSEPDLAGVVALLRPWVEGTLGQRLGRAKGLERRFAWSFAWPPGSGSSTVFFGQADFVARDAGGVCDVVIFSTPGSSDAAERLRLLLSARAAEALGQGKVREAWHVRLGDVQGPGLLGEDDFGDPAIEAAVGALLTPAVGQA